MKFPKAIIALIFLGASQVHAGVAGEPPRAFKDFSIDIEVDENTRQLAAKLRNEHADSVSIPLNTEIGKMCVKLALTALSSNRTFLMFSSSGNWCSIKN